MGVARCQGDRPVLIVREATTADIETVLDFWREAEAVVTATDDASALMAVLDHPTAFLLLAFDGDDLAGTVIGGFDGWRGGIYRLAVSPAHRRHGLARRLVADAAGRLEAMGARRIAAVARADQPAAVAFWDAAEAGFSRGASMIRYARG